MPKIKIEGKHPLKGEIQISGAKNGAVALIPASILCKNKSVIYNVPDIRDIEYLIKILNLLGCVAQKKNQDLYIDSSNIKNTSIPEELSREMRASYYFMGALLGRFKKVEISFPGGCKIGNRPIDLHIKGFEKLGAHVIQEKNRYYMVAEELIGTKIYLDISSVGATINIMLAAVYAKGTTIIENAAKEPEIVNIASFLINMGANIVGAGTSVIKIEGTENLDNGVVEVFPDRIEVGTYLIIGALLADELKINNVIKDHISTFLAKLKDVGCDFVVNNDTITIKKVDNLKATSIKTLPYPGFPTDLQQPFTTLLTQANGVSVVQETIYESRFRNVEYLETMGANTKIVGNVLEIKGPTKLYGKNVFATDLRAGASLLIAGLIAEGETVIDNIDLILRGYENVIEKLKNVGAKIELIE